MTQFDPADFGASYKLDMIRSYSSISGMTDDDIYGASRGQLDVAFNRILGNRNLSDTHRMYLEDRASKQAAEEIADSLFIHVSLDEER